MADTAAPGRLELVRQFLNTADVGSDADDLDSPEALRRWLGERLADPGEVDGAGLERARELREAVRALAAGNHGEPVPEAALGVLDRAAQAARLRPRFSAAGAVLDPEAAGLEGALGSLVAAVYEAMATGTWSRFKVCARQSCRWAFYDASRNRSGTWCSMRVCGNRTKSERFRRRSAASR